MLKMFENVCCLVGSTMAKWYGLSYSVLATVWIIFLCFVLLFLMNVMMYKLFFVVYCLLSVVDVFMVIGIEISVFLSTSMTWFRICCNYELTMGVINCLMGYFWIDMCMLFFLLEFLLVLWYIMMSVGWVLIWNCFVNVSLVFDVTS